MVEILTGRSPAAGGRLDVLLSDLNPWSARGPVRMVRSAQKETRSRLSIAHPKRSVTVRSGLGGMQMARLTALGATVGALSLCGCVTTSMQGYADRALPAHAATHLAALVDADWLQRAPWRPRRARRPSQPIERLPIAESLTRGPRWTSRKSPSTRSSIAWATRTRGGSDRGTRGSCLAGVNRAA
jgi:hypothetical protein